MKHLKLFEGFMDDIRQSVVDVFDNARKPYDACLHELIDDYGLQFDGDKITNMFSDRCLVYYINEPTELSLEAVNKIVRAVKRLGEFEELRIAGAITLYFNNSPISASFDKKVDIHKYVRNIMNTKLTQYYGDEHERVIEPEYSEFTFTVKFTLYQAT
jgi:hypothetical protein